MASVSITTQKSKTDSEQIHIFLRLSIGSKKRLKKVCTIFKKNWNEEEKKAIGANAQAVNKMIQIQKSDLEKEVYQKEVFGEGATLDVVKNKHSRTNKNKTEDEEVLFVDFARKEIKLMEGTYAKSTVKHYKSHTTEIEKFNNNLTLTNITHEVVQKLEIFFTKNGNSTNTIANKFKFIKVILNLAKKKKLQVHYPFDTFKVKKTDTTRGFLTQEEFVKCYDIYRQNILSEKHQNVLEYFLFSCLTGCRYSDVLQFDMNKHIYNKMILIKMEKTNDYVRLPISDKVKFILDSLKDRGLTSFNVLSNQKTNQNLKEAMYCCQIFKKNVTFHVARHTFATLSLTLGVNLKVVSTLLGHRKIATTEIYAKVIDESKIDAMNRFNDL